MGKSHPHMALYYLYGTVPPCRAPDIFVDADISIIIGIFFQQTQWV